MQENCITRNEFIYKTSFLYAEKLQYLPNEKKTRNPKWLTSWVSEWMSWAVDVWKFMNQKYNNNFINKINYYKQLTTALAPPTKLCTNDILNVNWNALIRFR